MTVTGLSGKSGTGKSYNAVELAANIGAVAIIDDGLLISGGRILAGVSAKKQKTKIGAVKTALFTEDDHAYSVKAAIESLDPSHILVLGTSDEMICKICDRLSISRPERIYHIEEITSPEERAIADKARNEAGMHTVPAPTFQVKKQFSGIIIDPARAFKDEPSSEPGDGYGESAGGIGSLFAQKSRESRKTVVRPTFSYLGSYEISDKAIEQIARHIVNSNPSFSELLFATCTNGEEGMYVRLIVIGKRGCDLIREAEMLQAHITTMLSHMTSFNILGVEVEIRGYS